MVDRSLLLQGSIHYTHFGALTQYPDVTLVTTLDRMRTQFPRLLLHQTKYGKHLEKEDSIDLLMLEMTSVELEMALRFLLTGCLPDTIDKEVQDICAILGLNLFDKKYTRVPVGEVEKVHIKFQDSTGPRSSLQGLKITPVSKPPPGVAPVNIKRQGLKLMPVSKLPPGAVPVKPPQGLKLTPVSKLPPGVVPVNIIPPVKPVASPQDLDIKPSELGGSDSPPPLNMDESDDSDILSDKEETWDILEEPDTDQDSCDNWDILEEPDVDKDNCDISMEVLEEEELDLTKLSEVNYLYLAARVESYICCICSSFETASEAKLEQHRQQEHEFVEDDPNPKMKELKHFCPLCGLGHRKRSELGLHDCKDSLTGFTRWEQEFSAIRKKTSLYRLGCKLCPYLTWDKFELEQHALRHKHTTVDNNLWHFCTLCELGFESEKEKSEHKESVHYDEIRESIKQRNKVKSFDTDPPKQPSMKKSHLQCKVCSEVFKTSTLFKDHVLKHRKLLECAQCGFKGSKAGLILHHRKMGPHHDNRCTQCQVPVESFSEYQEHVKVNHQNEWTFKCGRCKEIFPSSHERDQHMMKEDVNEVRRLRKKDFMDKKREKQRKTRVTDPGICDICGEHFVMLKKHFVRAHAPKTIQCSECELKFPTELLMKNHHVTIHERPYACEICGLKFGSQKHLSDHQGRMHTEDEDKPFQCSVCGKGFLYQYKMEDHKNGHTMTRPHQCNICGKSFTARNNHGRHMKQHREGLIDPNKIRVRVRGGLKQCPECKDCFPTHPELKAHMAHSKHGYPCPQCDMKFPHLGGRHSHLISIHTKNENKPFRCRFCPKGFVVKSKLDDHENIHRDSRPHKCDQCGKGFNGRPNLLGHLKMHEGVKRKRRNVAARSQ